MVVRPLFFDITPLSIILSHSNRAEWPVGAETADLAVWAAQRIRHASSFSSDRSGELPRGAASGGVVSGGEFGRKNRAVTVWCCDDDRARVIHTHDTAVRCLAAFRSGGVVSGGGGTDGEVAVWDRGDDQALVIHTHGGSVRCLVALDSGEVVGGGDDGVVAAWSRGDDLARVVYSHDAFVNCLAALRFDGVASGGGDGAVVTLGRT